MSKEEEILKAAEEEFFRNGYDACSTAAIARKAGVTHAMVNYYFRSKERLFVQILDNHVHGLLQSLKPLMTAEGDIVNVSVDAALAIFDKMNENRRFPFLLGDIARTHPDFLTRYKETFQTICKDSIKMHEIRLEKSIAAGSVAPCTMDDIYSSVVTLAVTPFFVLPILENVARLDSEEIDARLRVRREEMVRLLRARYAAGRQD